MSPWILWGVAASHRISAPRPPDSAQLHLRGPSSESGSPPSPHPPPHRLLGLISLYCEGPCEPPPALCRQELGISWQGKSYLGAAAPVPLTLFSSPDHPVLAMACKQRGDTMGWGHVRACSCKELRAQSSVLESGVGADLPPTHVACPRRAMHLASHVHFRHSLQVTQTCRHTCACSMQNVRVEYKHAN